MTTVEIIGVTVGVLSILGAGTGAVAFVWRSSQAWSRVELKLDYLCRDFEGERGSTKERISLAAEGRKALHQRQDDADKRLREVEACTQMLANRGS